MNSYNLTLTLPPNTTAAAPVRVTVNSQRPVIVSGVITIPPGPAGLAFVRLLAREARITPADGSFFNGDNAQYPFSGYWRVDGPPWPLTLEGYNLDDTYQHVITALVTCDDL